MERTMECTECHETKHGNDFATCDVCSARYSAENKTEATPAQEGSGAVVDTGITIPLSAPAPTPVSEESAAGTTKQTEAPPKPTKDDVMSLFGQVAKWGELTANVGAAMILVGFADDGNVGALQMLSSTVTMTDEALISFVKVSEQALVMCKDTIKKRRPELFPAEGPVIGNLNEFKRMA